MSADEIKKLVAARGQAKATITRVTNFTDQKVAELDSYSEEYIENKIDLLKGAFNEYKEYNFQVLIMNETSAEDVEQIEEKYLNTLSLLQRAVKPVNRADIKKQFTPNATKIKLPSVEIPPFNGKSYAEFKAFIGLFESLIDRDPSLSNVQKLYYLRTFLKDDALDLIINLPLIEQSYETAMQLLKQRFDNKYKMVSDHIAALLDIPSVVKGNSQSLRSFISLSKQHLSALEALGQPVEKWDMLIIAILNRKLDIPTSREFQMQRETNSLPTAKSFFQFLDKRALALENTPEFQPTKPSRVSIAVSSNNIMCPYCKLPHKLYACPRFKLVSPQERLQFISDNNFCKLCLNKHGGRCNLKIKCAHCNSQHNSLIHVQRQVKSTPVRAANAASTSSTSSSTPDADLSPKETTFNECLNEEYNDSYASVDSPTSPNVVLFSENDRGSILLPTVIVKIADLNATRYARALLDSGSQASFVTKRLASQLNIKPSRHQTGVIGIGNIKTNLNSSINIEIMSCKTPFKVKVDCHIVEKITATLPQCPIDISKLNLPKDLQLADETFHIPGEIDILLGANVFFQSLSSLQSPCQLRKHNSSASNGPRIVDTLFGHVIAGNVSSVQGNNNKKVTLFCQSCDSDINVTLKQFWQNESVSEVYTEFSSEKQRCEDIFQESVTLIDKKFCVSLPLKVKLNEINETLGDSFSIAMQRFLNLEKRFQKDQQLFAQYKKFIDEYVALGHAEYIDSSKIDFDKDPIYFLPHHPVLRPENKTSPCRVVFDGSAQTRDKKVSINDLQLNGPVVQKELFDILMQFRMNKYFFITDITKMFRMCNLHPQFRSLLLILWRDNPDDDIKIIQLNTVTYGLKSSSFLATRCLLELALKYEKQYPLAASAIINSCYCDDILYGSDNKEQLLIAKEELIALLDLGSFQLHKWCSNVHEILSDIPTNLQQLDVHDLDRNNLSIKTLGLKHDITNDKLIFECPRSHSPEKCTKREVCSFISRFFDPLGLVGPIIVAGKILLQNIWEANLSWDAPLTSSLNEQWQNFATSLTTMPAITLPRSINVSNAILTQLIGFADGSNKAHGCSIYLRVVDSDSSVHVHLLCSKSRINPIKCDLTTPRVELNGALLLSKTVRRVQEILKIKFKRNIDTILYLDSQIVLAWINTDPVKLNCYVANRVKIITEHTKGYLWQFIQTTENPADVLSRGIEPSKLHTFSLWWKGPPFLSEPNYVPQPLNVQVIKDLPEIKQHSPQQIFSLSIVEGSEFTNCFNIKKYSSVTKLTRIMAYCLRFIHNLKAPKSKRNGHLSVKELNDSLSLIIKNEQKIFFYKDIELLKCNKPIKNETLKALHPFLDSNNLLRVGGRLQNSVLPYAKKHPIILPKGSYLTDRIIQNEHLRLLHAGNKLLLASLSQKYWIISAIRQIKKIVHRCVTCHKLKAEASKQLMGSLPKDRVSIALPFQKTGIDFCGPFVVKQSRMRKVLVSKAYVLLFVCFVTKAIHIELASDLTTECFLACLRRFISRRNMPSDIYCDNASTFKGAKNELYALYKLQSSQVHQSAVHDYATNNSIKFHFIPAYSPVFGGLWEAGVKSVKYHLVRAVGNNILTYEELYTVLVQVEAIVNSRPITQITSDCNDMSYLTPAHFLCGAPLSSPPEYDLSEIPTNRLKFWNLCTKMRQEFWKTWHRQYLTLLQSRPKWRDNLPNLKNGSLVILRNSDTSPLHWPMARVTNVIHGQDGKVRVIDVRTVKGNTIRTSLQKICLLPLE